MSDDDDIIISDDEDEIFYIDNGKKRRALSRIRRELSDEELLQSGTIKLLLDKIDFYESEIDDLKEKANSYIEAQIERKYLKYVLSIKSGKEIFVTIVTTLGGTLVGLFPSFYKENLFLGISLAIIGVGLVVAASILLSKKKEGDAE